MSMERIRRFYDVPAKRGMEIVFDGTPVVITGSTDDAMYLLVREKLAPRKTFRIHPTWNVEYPAGGGS